jgi:hypothetical protein
MCGLIVLPVKPMTEIRAPGNHVFQVPHFSDEGLIVVFTELTVTIHQLTTLDNFLEGGIKIFGVLEASWELGLLPQVPDRQRGILALNPKTKQ